ncbi:MAG TPA: MoxR family ATPase [Candidatus Dormibacteraeota bacterium]|nr:MoxR family ATPase [Candidatus Dormibacteraeota bacterium]
MSDEPVMDLQGQSAKEETQAGAVATIANGPRRVREALGRVIVGQDEAIDLALVALLAGGHALVEGVPGVGKTLLVKALARAVSGEFQRIQFTPDLMPADVTGTSVFDLKAQEFRLMRGPIFTNFLLADEINRAPAKTQSALLEAMQERQVTIDRETCPLPPVFIVFATQNPIEHQGTYPLPEAQKDRFLVKIRMGYPAAADENELAKMVAAGEAPERRLVEELRTPVLQPGEIEQLRAATARVRVSDAISSYIVEVVRQTRQHPAVWVGAGPRATLALLSASRALAVLEERDFVLPEDVKTLAAPVLEHRIVLRPEFEMEGVELREVINAVLEAVEVPR